MTLKKIVLPLFLVRRDTQQNDTRHNDIQHNNKQNATISITQYNNTQNNSRALLCCVSFMLSVTYAEYHMQPLYAECHYSKCHYAERNYAERHYAERHFAERHYAERHYAERHYAERHYAKCRGAIFSEKIKRRSKEIRPKSAKNSHKTSQN